MANTFAKRYAETGAGFDYQDELMINSSFVI